MPVCDTDCSGGTEQGSGGSGVGRASAGQGILLALHRRDHRRSNRSGGDRLSFGARSEQNVLLLQLRAIHLQHWLDTDREMHVEECPFVRWILIARACFNSNDDLI